MVAFATAHCVMGKLGLQSVRNWFNGMKKFFNNVSFALSNCRWHPHQYREEKAERGILVWKRSQGSVFRVQSFLGRPQKKFLEKNQDACLDILVNLNYYKEKAENPKAGEAQDLSFVFFWQSWVPAMPDICKGGVRNWRNYHHLERVWKCSWRVHSRQEGEWWKWH